MISSWFYQQLNVEQHLLPSRKSSSRVKEFIMNIALSYLSEVFCDTNDGMLRHTDIVTNSYKDGWT